VNNEARFPPSRAFLLSGGITTLALSPEAEDRDMRLRVGIALLAIVPFLTLAGCASPSLTDCRRTYSVGSPGYNACWTTELQRENEELDRQDALSRRGKD
jgi:hypothetical protein